MKEEPRTPILYRPSIFFYTVALGPIIIVSLCFYFYVSREQQNLKYIPNISEVTCNLPESRMFLVGMNICGWVSVPLSLILDRILKLIQRTKKCAKDRDVLVARYTMNVFSGLSFLSFVGLSCININECRIAHLAFGISLIISLTCVFLLVDYGLSRADIKLSQFHWFINVIPISCFIVSFALYKFGNDDNLLNSISSVIQYIGGSLLVLKLLMIYRSLPSIGLILTRKVQ